MLDQKVKLPLFLLRLGVFIVFAVWIIDKFVRPEHTAGVWGSFYFIDNVGASVSFIAGVIQGGLVIGMMLGFAKRITYAGVFLMHLVGTVTPFKQYLAAFDGVNILFFAAWPMLAACAALYLLRDYDTMFSPLSPPAPSN